VVVEERGGAEQGGQERKLPGSGCVYMYVSLYSLHEVKYSLEGRTSFIAPTIRGSPLINPLAMRASEYSATRLEE
jgi:hypothetical protein